MASYLNFNDWLQLKEAGSLGFGSGIPAPHYRGNKYRYTTPHWDIGNYDSEGKPLFNPKTDMGKTGTEILGAMTGHAKERIGSYYYGMRGKPPILTQNIYMKNDFGGTARFEIKITDNDITVHGGELEAVREITKASLIKQGQDIDAINWNSLKILGVPQKGPDGKFHITAQVTKKLDYKHRRLTHVPHEDWDDEWDDDTSTPDTEPAPQKTSQRISNKP